MSNQQARVAELGDLVPKLAEDASGRHKDHAQELLKELASPAPSGSARWTGEPEPISGFWQASFSAPAHTCVVQLPGKNVGVLKMAKGGKFTLFVRFKKSLLKAWAETHGQAGAGQRVWRRLVEPEQATKLLASARAFCLKEGEVHHPYALAILCTMSRMRWLVPPPDPNRFDIPNKGDLHLTLVALPPLDPILEQCLCLIGRKDTFCGVDDEVPLSGQAAVDARVWGKTPQAMVSDVTALLMSRAARDLVDHADVAIFTKCIPALNKTACVTATFLEGAVSRLQAPAPAPAPRPAPPNGRRSGMVASDDESEDSVADGHATPATPAPPPAPAPTATVNRRVSLKRGRANNNNGNNNGSDDDDDDTEKIAAADAELAEVDETEDSDDSSSSDSSDAPSGRPRQRQRAARGSSESSGSDGSDSDADAGAVPQPPNGSAALPTAVVQAEHEAPSQRVRAPAPASEPAPAPAAAAPSTESLMRVARSAMLETMVQQTGPWATRMREWVRTHQPTTDPSRMQRIAEDVEQLADPCSPAGMIASALSLTAALADLHGDRLTGETVTISTETQQRMGALTWKAKEFSATTVEHMGEVFRRLEEVQAQARGMLECVAKGDGASRAQQASAPAP